MVSGYEKGEAQNICLCNSSVFHHVLIQGNDTSLYCTSTFSLTGILKTNNGTVPFFSSPVMFCCKFWPFQFQFKPQKSYTSPVPKVPLVTQPDTPALSIQDVSPTKRALLIGISDYPHLLPHQQLPGCTNDVTLLHDL